ncbi:hypothetical protein CSUI_007931, partial [Cystoisospora suis]
FFLSYFLRGLRRVLPSYVECLSEGFFLSFF